MLTILRGGDESHDVVLAVLLKNILSIESSSASDTFVLGPGYEAVGNGQVQGQVPQALPGKAHDVSPPMSQNAPSTVTLPTSANPTPHSAIVASSSSSSPAPSSMSEGPSAPSASSLSVLPSISASVQPPVDISSTSSPSDRAWSSVTSSVLPTSTSHGMTSTASLSSSVTSSMYPSISAIIPAAAISSDNGHGPSFWAGIALISIAGTATIITLFAWWIRMRSRPRRRPWESGWRWRRTESYGSPEDAILSSGDSTSLWQQLVDRDVSGPSRSTSNLLPSYMTASHDLHIPPPAALSPFTRGSYQNVRLLPLEMRHSNTSVPGVMQDIGSLRVANLVAGDILTSSDESSRPPTALDNVGTPRELAMFKPRYLGLNGSGLNVPWILTPQSPLQPEPNRPPPLSPPRPPNLITPLSDNRWQERPERSSVGPTVSPDTRPRAIETWRDTLRNNIANTLGVLTSTMQTPPARPQSYTYVTNAEVAHAPPTMSETMKPWTLEETFEGAGIVHIRGVPNTMPVALSRRSITTGVARRTGQSASPTSTRVCIVPSPPPRESLVPPRLPHLLPLPRVPRMNAVRSKSTKGQHGSRRLRQLVRLSSSSASSATSVGSDMSRSSGGVSMARWTRLSKKEEAARQALRQRRLQTVSSRSFHSNE